MNQSLNQDLIELLSHCRDLSVRDGQQSLDGNRMRIEDIVPVLKELNGFYELARDEYGLEIPPTEVWGGGTVKQPVNFNGEDPLDNLKKMREAAPSLILQDLYRGRQGYGFQPTSREVQFAATERAYELGIRSHRIFDMMNDIENLKNGIEAAKTVNEAHLEDPMRIEGAISYISEPDGEKVMSPQDYADYAVELAEAGCDDIVIKDYAGLLMDEQETKDLIQTIRKRLDEKHPDIRISLHSHGHKPEILSAALEAGANFVDTALGDLSKGTSHTNMRELIEMQMKAKGHDLEELAEHPIMHKLAEVEKVVEKETIRHKPHRIPPEVAPTKEQVAKYRFAGGGYAAHMDECMRTSNTKDVNNEKAQKLYRASLEIMPALWEKAGRFNTVTPGARVLSKEAIVWASTGNVDKILELVEQKKGEALSVEDLGQLKQPKLRHPLRQEYKDIVMGRYGRNRGMERGIGDTDMRAMFLLEDGLKQVFHPENPLGLKGKAIAEGMAALGLKNKQLNDRSRVTILKKLQEAKYPETLRQDLVKVIEQSNNINEEQRAELLRHFDVGRFPDPTVGLEVADDLVKHANDNGIDFNKHYHKGEQDVRLLAALTANGTDVSLARHLTDYLASDKKEIPAGSKIEPERSKEYGVLRSIEPKVREWMNIKQLLERELAKKAKVEKYPDDKLNSLSSKSNNLRQLVSEYAKGHGVDVHSAEFDQALFEIRQEIEQTRPKSGQMKDYLDQRSATQGQLGRG